MKSFFAAVWLIFFAVPAFALTVESELLGEKAYATIVDSANVVYVERCSRSVFAAYEWKIWEGFHSVRAYVEPIALITVSREETEIIDSMDPFISKAVDKCRAIGANFLCLVSFKKTKNELGIKKMVFRGYKQFFQSGVPDWVSFYDQLITKGLPLKLNDVQEKK